VNAGSIDIRRRNEYVMALVVFVVFAGFAAVVPFLSLYVRELGVTDDREAAFWGGLLISVATLVAGLMAPVWGRLADRYGYKIMAQRVLVSYCLFLALSAAVTSVTQLLVLRVAVGLFGGIGPLAVIMASATASRGEAGRAIGLMQAAQILAAAAGPALGGVLAYTIGMRWTFVATAMLCGLALLLLGSYDESARPAPAPHDAGAGPSSLTWTRLAALMALLFFVNFVGRSFTPVLPLQIERAGISPARSQLATGLLMSVYSIAAAISATGLGRAARARSARVLMVTSLGLGALLLAPIGWVSSFPALLVLAGALGLAFGGALTLGYTIGDTIVPEGRRGATFGYLTGAALFGGSISPLIAGYLARVWELTGIYFVDAAVCVVLALAVAAHGWSPRPVAPKTG
jgi:MFS transporter, DHA1 family, multidrug resistance protein